MANAREALESILPHLHSVHIDRAVTAAQTWLDQTEHGEITDALIACPITSRPRLTTLFRDLITGYPYLLGAPVLILATQDSVEDQEGHEGTFRHALPHGLRLPMLSGDPALLPDDLSFLGWASGGLHSRTRAIESASAPRTIPWGQVAVRIALFQYVPRVPVSYDELPEITCAWWGNVFAPVLDVATVSLCDLPLLPYPDAVEVADALEASALGLRPQGTHYFAGSALIARCERRAAMLLPARPHRL